MNGSRPYGGKDKPLPDGLSGYHCDAIIPSVALELLKEELGDNRKPVDSQPPRGKHQNMPAEVVQAHKDTRKQNGMFFTPQPIVDLMVSLADFSGGRCLEPGCGLGPFLATLAANTYGSLAQGSWEEMVGTGFRGVELSREVCERATEYFSGFVEEQTGAKKVPSAEFEHRDFLLMEPKPVYDLVIGNPPYGIVAQNAHYPIRVTHELKQRYKSASKTWKGKYNIYGLFIEHAVRFVRPGGKLLFIVPATFMILDEFELLRKYLATSGRVEVYYLGPGVFPDATVTTAVLKVEMGGKGLALWDCIKGEPQMVVNKPQYRGELIAFEDDLCREVEKSAIRLDDLYSIFISARSTEIRNCSYVQSRGGADALPLLSGRNLLVSGEIDYATNHTGKWVRKKDLGRLRAYYSHQRVAVGHTKGGRIVAAVDEKRYPWTGDVYHLVPKTNLLRSGKARISDDELARILNSPLINEYARRKYREITMHTTATQLRELPLHSIAEWRELEERLGFVKQG